MQDFRLLAMRSGLGIFGRLQDSFVIPALLLVEGGMAAALFVVLSGLTALPKGIAADRWGRPFLLIQVFGIALAGGVLFFSPLLGAFLLGLVRMNIGGLQQAIWAGSPWAPQGIAWETFLNTAVILLGPLLLALSLLLLSPDQALLLGQAAIVLALGIWSLFSLPAGKSRPRPSRQLLRALWKILLLGATLSFLFAAMQTEIVELFKSSSPWKLAAVAGGSMFAALLMLRLQRPSEKVARVLFVGAGTALILTPLWPALGLLLLAGGLYGASMISIRIPLAASDLPEKFQAFAALVAVSSLGAGLGYLSVGWTSVLVGAAVWILAFTWREKISLEAA